jgi:hypothetical protein
MKRRKMLSIMTNNYSWIIVISIIILFLLSFLPLVKVTESDNVKEELFFNFDMMKISNNKSITKLADQLDSIEIFLYITIIFGIFSLIAATFYSYKRNIKSAHLLIVYNVVILILGLFIILEQCFFIINVNNSDNISLANIFSVFHYVYIVVIFEIILLFFSILYMYEIIRYIIYYHKNIKKKKS